MKKNKKMYNERVARQVFIIFISNTNNLVTSSADSKSSLYFGSATNREKDMIKIKKVNCSKRIFHWQIKINNHSFEQIPLFKTKKDAKKWLINNSYSVKTMSEFSYNKKFDVPTETQIMISKSI